MLSSAATRAPSEAGAGTNGRAGSGRSRQKSVRGGAPTAGTRIDTNYVRVTYNPSSGTPRDLSRATDSSCSNGQWYFSAFDDNAQPTQIDLCPDTCSTAKGDTGASIVVTFTCNEVQ